MRAGPPARPARGPMRRIGTPAREHRRARAASRASRATSAAPPLARLDDPKERAHEVVGGRHLADIDAGADCQLAQFGLAVLAGLAKTAPELGVARVDYELLAAL